MASLESVSLRVQNCEVANGAVLLAPLKVFNAKTKAQVDALIENVPVVVWGNGEMWTQANLWLYARAKLALSGSLKIESVQNNGTDLHAYAKWLEANDPLDWRHFPRKPEQRCLNRYRGALVAARDAGELAPSVATRRMSSLLRFYRWVQAQGIMRSDFPLWDDRRVSVRLVDAHGFSRTMHVTSSDLAIPHHRPNDNNRLEDGAEPVSNEHRNAILQIAHEYASVELYLMLAVGFSSGMRLGSITDLKIRTLENAVPLQGTDKVMTIAIGPEAKPPVSTKYGKSGRGIILPTSLREELLDYALGVRRGLRQQLARAEDKDVVFLTKTGARYASRGVNRSATINGEMARLRKVARAHGVDMERFNFHWTRATFATGWAQAALEAGKGEAFMPALMEMMLHKDEATTWRYIRFVKNQKVRAELADLFTREMFGLIGSGSGENA